MPPLWIAVSTVPFNQFADALSWIMRANYGVTSHIHYLDDYLLVRPADSDQCHRQMESMLSLCTRLGIPVATNKLEGPTTCLTFLGIQINSIKQELSLPPSNLQELEALTLLWLAKKKCIKRQLLSLVNKLVFTARVVPAGRFFIRRLIDLSCTVRKLDHHIHLNEDARADIHWWRTFLPDWNGKSIFLQSFWIPNELMELFSDASGTLGYGACFQQEMHHDIQWKELYAIVVTAATWGHRWSSKRILFHCDNLTIVNSWSKGSSKNKESWLCFRTSS